MAGIETLAKAVKEIVDLTIETVDNLEDNKVTIGEILGYTDNAVKLTQIFVNASQLKDEVLDLSPEERARVSDIVLGKLPNKKTKEYSVGQLLIFVEDALQAVISISRMILNGIEFKKKLGIIN